MKAYEEGKYTGIMVSYERGILEIKNVYAEAYSRLIEYMESMGDNRADIFLATIKENVVNDISDVLAAQRPTEKL